jgi:hypothetical protein
MLYAFSSNFTKITGAAGWGWQQPVEGMNNSYRPAWTPKLEHFVDFPTQVRGNSLDLILTNIPEIVVEVKDVGRLGRNDHVMIIDINVKEVKTTESVPNWASGQRVPVEE